MGTWVDDFLAYAETAVSRATVVTTPESLPFPGTQSGERPVTSGGTVAVEGNNTARTETKETTKHPAGLPPEPSKFTAVTQVTLVTDENGRYERQYQIDERAAILQFSGRLPRDEAISLQGLSRPKRRTTSPW